MNLDLPVLAACGCEQMQILLHQFFFPLSSSISLHFQVTCLNGQDGNWNVEDQGSVFVQGRSEFPHALSPLLMFRDTVWQFAAEANQELFTWSQPLWASQSAASAAAAFTAERFSRVSLRPSPATVMTCIWLFAALGLSRLHPNKKSRSCTKALAVWAHFLPAPVTWQQYTCSLCKQYPVSQVVSEEGLSSWNPIRPIAHFLMRVNLSVDYDQLWYQLLLKGAEASLKKSAVIVLVSLQVLTWLNDFGITRPFGQEHIESVWKMEGHLGWQLD